MYFAQWRNAPEDAIEAVTQTFLGVQLQCARCHDHPVEAWKQKDFYGMAAFLARLDVVTRLLIAGRGPQQVLHDPRLQRGRGQVSGGESRLRLRRVALELVVAGGGPARFLDGFLQCGFGARAIPLGAAAEPAQESPGE